MARRRDELLVDAVSGHHDSIRPKPALPARGMEPSN